MWQSKVWILLLTLVFSVLAQETCETHNFEDDFEEVMNTDRCIVDNPWIRGRYDEIIIDYDDLHPNSQHYISPATTFSCIASNSFPVSVGGVIEVKMYIESDGEAIQILLLQEDTGSTIGPIEIDFNQANGWRTIRATVFGTDETMAYISFMGQTSANSIILIDYYRYIPPDYNEEECRVYSEDGEDPPSSAGPPTSVQSTPDPPTSDPLTTDPFTSDPLTTDPFTSDQFTTDPFTTDPFTTHPFTSDPFTTDPFITDPFTTDPFTTDPFTTDPFTTDPSTTDPSTPDPSTPDPFTPDPYPATPDVETDSPDSNDNKRLSWWLIALISSASLFVLGLICWMFYQLGRKRENKKLLRHYIDDPVPVQIIPRVRPASNINTFSIRS